MVEIADESTMKDFFLSRRATPGIIALILFLSGLCRYFRAVETHGMYFLVMLLYVVLFCIIVTIWIILSDFVSKPQNLKKNLSYLVLKSHHRKFQIIYWPAFLLFGILFLFFSEEIWASEMIGWPLIFLGGSIISEFFSHRRWIKSI